MDSEIYQQIFDAAVEVHNHLGGPGLLETVYESALCHELSLRGLRTKRQIPIPVTYKNSEVRDPLFLDILVDNKVIIEVKATGKIYPFHHAQLLTYLRLSQIESGLLINFGNTDIREAIFQITNPLLIAQKQVAPQVG
jgi:GxxExxY protein